MKKIIGILGVVVLTMTMFFSTNTNAAKNLDLASLTTLNSANAECNMIRRTSYWVCNAFDRCIVSPDGSYVSQWHCED